MAAPTFNYQAHRGSGGHVVKSRIFQAALGDGYEQRTQAGLIGQDRMYKFAAKDEDNATVEAMEDFLDDLNSVRPFYWTRPGSSTPELWIQEGEYRRLNEKASSSDFQVTFKRWYGAEE
jgi:phage-related protein